jgi:hypothetical protein
MSNEVVINKNKILKKELKFILRKQKALRREIIPLGIKWKAYYLRRIVKITLS